MPVNFANEYPKAMKEHPYGYALYRPARSSILKPGACGYLDRNGRWNPVISNIQEPPINDKKPFTLPSQLSYMAPETHTWGPKAAADVAYNRLAFAASADALAAGFPAEVKMALEFSSEKDFGAVLHCGQPVEEQGFYHRKVFVQWAKANAQALLQFCPDVRDQGVWIVMSTFETQDVNICAWSGKRKTVSMGFRLVAAASGEIGPSGEFVRGVSASAWDHDSLDECDGRLVVFFTGVFLRYRHLPLGLASRREVRGGEAVVVQDPNDPSDYYDVECTVVDRGSIF